MLWIGKDKAERLWIGGSPVAVLWIGALKVYEAVRSCFGSGRWIRRKPWIGKEKWKTKR